LNTAPEADQVRDSAHQTSFRPHFFFDSFDEFGPHCLERLASDAVLRARRQQSDPGFPNVRAQTDLASLPGGKDLSAWSRSPAKRFFDCICVLFSLPLTIPLTLAVAAAVRLTSRGPVLFMQKRMGRDGGMFTILKFRSMVHVADKTHHAITTSRTECFTPIGPFLRRWKLDELPQLLNVLLGHMSLIGPRPKLREHAPLHLSCRPGITGMATIVFACEEEILSRVAKDQLDAFFHSVVLPAKRRLDAGYMARATFLSDLRLLISSVLRRWDRTALEAFFLEAAATGGFEIVASGESDLPLTVTAKAVPAGAARPAGAEQVSAF